MEEKFNDDFLEDDSYRVTKQNITLNELLEIKLILCKHERDNFLNCINENKIHKFSKTEQCKSSEMILIQCMRKSGIILKNSKIII